jgi:hypothetical protein
MFKLNFRAALPHLVAGLIFLILIFAYFPELLDHKSLKMDDIEQHKGMSNELADYRERTGEEAIWTNAMFSGMPGYLISVVYKGNLLVHLGTFMKLGLPRPADYLFILMYGIYFLLLVLKVRQPLAILGAAAYSFSTYNLLIMEAGHTSKVDAISWMPWVFAAVILTFNGRLLVGGILTAIFLSLQIKSSHFQITYYLAFILAFYGIAQLVYFLKRKEFSNFIKPTAVLLLAAVLGIFSNISSLYTIYDYSKDSIRGKSELTIKGETESSGLDKDYALAYSYGIGETFSYLIPNVYGGASNLSLADQKSAIKDIEEPYKGVMQQVIPQYWSDTDTTGPFYAGAIMCFLCVLGLFIVKGPIKWAILASLIFAFLLSWGKNFEDLSVFMLNTFPGYNKFRAVKMILIISDFLIPLMAVLGLNEVINNPAIMKEKQKLFWASFALTGGLCLLFYLMPDTFFSFDYLKPQIKEYLLSALAQNGSDATQSEQWISGLMGNLETVRIEIFKADAMRSFLLIALAAIALFAYGRLKFNPIILAALMLVATIGDLWSVDKRYVNKKDFVSNNKAAIPFDPSVADEAIFSAEIQKNPTLKSKVDSYQVEAMKRVKKKSGNQTAEENKSRFRGLLANTDYRVLNLSTSTFNDAATSFFHKSVGGYSAAKLERYQEFIEFKLQPAIQQFINVLNKRPTDSLLNASLSQLNAFNMLNTRYIIYSKDSPPILNKNALGNAWFVENVKEVANADEEITAIDSTFSAKKTALVDKRFHDQLEGWKSVKDSTATVKLDSYAPNQLNYSYTCRNEQVIVFSEIYYDKGWNAFIDGKSVPHFRTNYVLRGMRVPGGSHKIELRFEPTLYYSAERISMAVSGFIGLLAIGILIVELRRKKLV